jgi:hypothetical protein
MAEATAKKASGLFSKQSATRTKNVRPGRKNQILILLGLCICCFASFYFFNTTMQLVERAQQPQDTAPPMPNPEITTETKEIDQIAGDLSGVGKATNMAMQVALMAEVHRGSPIAAASTLTPPPPPIQINPEPVAEPDPPSVTVLAVMITEGDSVAMIDVTGEDSGLLVRRGSKFSNGTARITKIDSKGVTFTWRKKSYQVGVAR